MLQVVGGELLPTGIGDFGNDLYVVSAVLALGFKGGVLRGRLYSAVGVL